MEQLSEEARAWIDSLLESSESPTLRMTAIRMAFDRGYTLLEIGLLTGYSPGELTEALMSKNDTKGG